MFSAVKEPDLGQNLVSGPLKNSGLGQAFRDSEKRKTAFADLAPYAPSNNQPARFLASSIVDAGGKRVGAAAIQIPINQINQIMQERTGLGKTGETYLVGPDKLMRSDSFLDPKNHTVEASFARPETGKVDTEASRVALTGQSGMNVIIDYNGNPVLSVYGAVDTYGVRWAIIAESDVAEAFVPMDDTGGEFYKKYVKLYGYYDLFLINPNELVFYTAAREPDYQSNMVDGKFSSSNLGRLVRDVLRTKSYGIADFAPYAPSNDDPAAFIAQPIVHKGEVEVIVALQISLEAINAIMQQRDGMGRTGETYIVGSDKLMRSDSFLDPANHSVKASFANPGKGKVDTEASRNALAGQSSSAIIIDYNGNPVLSAYAPLKVGEATWALIAEIDEAEAFETGSALRTLMLWTGLLGGALIGGIGFFIARSLANPVIAMTNAMTRLAQGALDTVIPARNRHDEIGDMAAAVQVFKDNAIEVKRLEAAQKEAEKRAEVEKKKTMNDLADTFEASVKGIVNGVASAATEMQSTAQSMSAISEETSRQATSVAAAAEQASVKVQTVSAAAEELSSSISEISRQVSQAAKISQAAMAQAGHTNEMVQGLAEAANRIGEVVEAHQRHRQPDQPPCPQRHHRGGPGGRGRQGFCRGGLGSEESRQPDRQGNR
ncbi:MAG: methyl-accepting chemotaxis sensory transducer [Rhodospirillaceae bacterium]|nr:MAG: methyl-accepting chemotaxis sensory transducer [Rhodospirillaceae bacterium]